MSKGTLEEFDILRNDHADFNQESHRLISEDIKKLNAADFTVYEDIISQFDGVNEMMARLDVQLSSEYGTGMSRDFLKKAYSETAEDIDYIDSTIDVFDRAKGVINPIIKERLSQALYQLKRDRDFLYGVLDQLRE